MGVSPQVGYLEMVSGDEEGVEWFRRDLDAVNALLAENGLPRHDEPATLPAYRFRAALGWLGFSWIHFLRRLQARLLQDPAWSPTPCDEHDEPWNDPAIDRELTVYIRSHLIVHSDAEGFYMPIDFGDMLYGEVPGGILGSSVRLYAELQQLAPALGVTLDAAGNLTDAEADRLNDTPQDAPFWREKLAWLHLFECARISVELRTAIVFK
jgi:hypothetical protein